MSTKKKIKTYIKNIINLPRLLNKPDPIYSKNESKSTGIKLHLGCGDINLQGWINVDGRPGSHIHIVSLDFNLSEFSDSSVSEIYMCHVLEHFSYKEGLDLINKLRKKLKPMGILRLSLPDFDKLINIYKLNKNNIKSIKSALMGGQTYELNFHKSMYNKSYLIEVLKEAGFINFIEWNPEKDFGFSIGDFSNATIKTKLKDEDISLNIKAILP